MQVSLTNPSGALPVSVVVNGKSYNCSGSTNANKIYVEIVNEAQFEGGDTELTIEKVNMTLDGDDYSIKPINNNEGHIFINGKIEVLSVDFVNNSYEVIDWSFPQDTV